MRSSGIVERVTVVDLIGTAGLTDLVTFDVKEPVVDSFTGLAEGNIERGRVGDPTVGLVVNNGQSTGVFGPRTFTMPLRTLNVKAMTLATPSSRVASRMPTCKNCCTR